MYFRKNLLQEATFAFSIFLVPIMENLFPKSSLSVKLAKVLSRCCFGQVSQDKESNIYVINYFCSSSVTTTLWFHSNAIVAKFRKLGKQLGSYCSKNCFHI